MHTRMLRTTAAAVALTTLGLTACSDDQQDTGNDDEAAEPTARERLADAKAVLDEATSVHLVLTSQNVPEDSDGIRAAEGVGTADPPAFEGEFTGRLQGLEAEVPVVAVDGDLHVKLPFAPRYVRTDPGDFNAPDPAQLFTPDQGISSLLVATQDPQFGEQSRAGREVVQTITGTLPGEDVNRVLQVGEAEGTFDVTYGILEDRDELRTAELVGPFFAGTDSTYTLALDRYGEAVEITAP